MVVWHEAVREGARCLTGRSTGGRASHIGETPEQVLHTGEGAGKRERPVAGPCGGGVGRRCGAVRGLEQPRRTPQLKWGNFLFFRD